MNEQKMIDLVNRIANNDKVAPFQNGFVVLTNEEMVKFAELIVRECAEVANENVGAFTPSCGNFVLDHFGVKE